MLCFFYKVQLIIEDWRCIRLTAHELEAFPAKMPRVLYKRGSPYKGSMRNHIHSGQPHFSNFGHLRGGSCGLRFSVSLNPASKS